MPATSFPAGAQPRPRVVRQSILVAIPAFAGVRVMFLPGEAFLYAAVEQDGSLIEDCLKNRVIIATPTTLIALLKAIEFGWRQEEVTQNAEEIRKHGKDLYDRIVTLMGHVNRLGSTLDSAVTAYNATVGSMESRVLVTARKIAELGAR